MHDLFKILLLCITLNGGAAQAVVTHVTDASTGKLLGATGVLVAGKSYDVQFKDGSCDGLGLCGNPFVFDDFFRATAAAEALLDQVFIDTAQGDFDSVPFLTEGCISEEVACTVMIPYAMDITNAHLITAENSADEEFGDGVFNFLESRTSDTTENSGMVYALWTPSRAVPEPGTLALTAAVGVALLGGRRRAGTTGVRTTAAG